MTTQLDDFLQLVAAAAAKWDNAHAHALRTQAEAYDAEIGRQRTELDELRPLRARVATLEGDAEAQRQDHERDGRRVRELERDVRIRERANAVQERRIASLEASNAAQAERIAKLTAQPKQGAKGR